MNPNSHPNSLVTDSDCGNAAGEADATLKLIAGLPAPDGLEERVHIALRTERRAARVIEWPARFRSENPWMRSAAAAAIAFAVVGGGWGVYSRVQTANVIAMPSQIQQGGFSNAGAKRTPQTLTGPTVNHPQNGQAGAQNVVKMPAHPEKNSPEEVKAKAARE